MRAEANAVGRKAPGLSDEQLGHYIDHYEEMRRHGWTGGGWCHDAIANELWRRLRADHRAIYVHTLSTGTVVQYSPSEDGSFNRYVTRLVETTAAADKGRVPKLYQPKGQRPGMTGSRIRATPADIPPPLAAEERWAEVPGRPMIEVSTHHRVRSWSSTNGRRRAEPYMLNVFVMKADRRPYVVLGDPEHPKRRINVSLAELVREAFPGLVARHRRAQDAARARAKRRGVEEARPKAGGRPRALVPAAPAP